MDDEYMNEELKDDALLLVIRIAVILSFYLGAVIVLESVHSLFTYSSFVQGNINSETNPEIYRAFEQVSQTPALFLTLSVYNILLWTSVIICGIWLLRHHPFSRKMLCILLGTDMIVTLAHLLWDSAFTENKISNPGWFIFFNVIQVTAIAVLSHPKIIDVVNRMPLQRKRISQ